MTTRRLGLYTFGRAEFNGTSHELPNAKAASKSSSISINLDVAVQWQAAVSTDSEWLEMVDGKVA